MIKNKKTIVRIMAAILLAIIWAVDSMNPLLKAINPNIQYDISIGSVLILISKLAIVISLFADNFNIMAIGAGLQIIGSLSDRTPILFLIIISYILIVVVAFLPKEANKLCLIAGVVALCVCMMFNYRITNGFKIMHFNYFINRLTWTIEVCLPFFAWSYIVETKTKEYSSNKSLIVEKEQPISNELDQVLKLKELLDLGVINEEEFNEKKKQILNLK